MNKMKNLLPVLILISVVLIGGCNKTINDSKGEGIKGVVEFLSRPCDPAIQNPNSCDVNFPDHNSLKIVIYNRNNMLIKEINLNKVSSSYYTYNTNLPQGGYIVDIKGVGGSWALQDIHLQDIQVEETNTIKRSLPKEVEIKSNATTTLNIQFYQA